MSFENESNSASVNGKSKPKRSRVQAVEPEIRESNVPDDGEGCQDAFAIRDSPAADGSQKNSQVRILKKTFGLLVRGRFVSQEFRDF